MKKIRCYWTYIATMQKVVQFVLIPLLALAAAVAAIMLERMLGTGIDTSGETVNMVFSIYLLYIAVICDVIHERNNFGGTFSSRASYVEYMKSSPKGVLLYRNILQGSVYVRFLYALLVTGLFYCTKTLFSTGDVSSALFLWVFFAGATWLGMQTGALFSRIIAAENISIFAAIISSMLISALFTLVSALNFSGQNRSLAIAGALALATGMLLAVVMIVIGSKKKEKEYHDV